tara:strand:+ start:2553 stop:3101 length:549 start_codon:yes stop_codon:yes gene_type:complete
MANVLFISESYLKNNTVIDDNVDQRIILPSIITAQDMRTHPVLGTPLYEDLKSKIVAGTLNADETTLIDNFIAKSLLYWSMYECSTSMLYKYRNKSVATKNSENAQPITSDDLQFLRDDWQNKAEFYDERLINHLIDNKSLFPKYQETSEDIHAKKTAYTTSFYLGQGKGNCYYDDYKYFKE